VYIMETYLPIFMFCLSVVFVVTQFVMLLLVAKSIREHKKDHLGDERMNTDLRARTEGIIQNAQTKANDILADAEKKGIAILASEESTGKQLSGEYSQKLTQIETEFKTELAKNAKQAVGKLDELLTQASHSMNDHISQSDKAFSEKTDGIKVQVDQIVSQFTQHAADSEKLMAEKSTLMLEETKKMFDALGTQTRADIKKQLEGELTQAKLEIDQYKQSRLKVINERIVDMLTDIVTVTLGKKLTLSDQSELVYQALEEAKREHAFTGMDGKK
jgi:F0F1-type ATP synthase membrane subunit b/b'